MNRINSASSLLPTRKDSRGSGGFSDDGIPSSQRDFAYYFIDMVSVVEVE